MCPMPAGTTLASKTKSSLDTSFFFMLFEHTEILTPKSSNLFIFSKFGLFLLK